MTCDTHADCLCGSRGSSSLPLDSRHRHGVSQPEVLGTLVGVIAPDPIVLVCPFYQQIGCVQSFFNWSS